MCGEFNNGFESDAWLFSGIDDDDIGSIVNENFMLEVMESSQLKGLETKGPE